SRRSRRSATSSWATRCRRAARSAPSGRDGPMLADDVLYKPVSDLSKLVRSRKVSPVELTRACLARIEALDPKLGAFATVTADLALEQARQAERSEEHTSELQSRSD